MRNLALSFFPVLLLAASLADAPVPDSRSGAAASPEIPETVKTFEAGAGIRIYLSENKVKHEI